MTARLVFFVAIVSTAPALADDFPDPPADSHLRVDPVPKAPVDPWTAVAGDQPRRMTQKEHDGWTVSAQLRACTAAIDHCITKDVWWLVADERRLSTRYAYPVRFGPTEPNEGGWYSPRRARASSPSMSNREAFTAYRTVPATKTNLTKGALVTVMSFPAKHPSSAMAALEAAYRIGELDRVDLDTGFIYLVGVDDPFWLSSARVCVLSWRVGEKVKIVGGAKRDQLAVAAKDVYLPLP